jgi:peptidoglycan L-alanyl-D-glutamate endopeptidase CwlK
MSAGTSSANVNHDLAVLAPLFRDSVLEAIAACQANGLDAFVYEGYRSPELQALYYSRGRTVIPPAETVTNARSNLYSWHGYGLAVDVISVEHEWNASEEWFTDVADIFRQHRCKWGGDWKKKDPPHLQWSACKPSPSDLARQILDTEGVQGVWVAVGAI